MAKTPRASTPPVSAFMRQLWAAEAEHPVFAGSLNNIKLILAVEDKPARKKNGTGRKTKE